MDYRNGDRAVYNFPSADCYSNSGLTTPFFAEAGNREQGTGNREQGTGNRGQRTGNGERGTGNRE
ncbi:MAG: hypothetical protein AB4426_32345 [Xenococcaceae cyanobacterium]